VPPNDWSLRLEAGVCLDIVPVGESGWAVRVYGMDDAFRGALADENTLWLGRPFPQWLQGRGLDFAETGLPPETDLQQAPLFPVLGREEITPELIEWMSCRSPDPASPAREVWKGARRLSAEEICTEYAPQRASALRAEFLGRALPALAANHRFNPFYRLDLARTAQFFASTGRVLSDLPEEPTGLAGVHDAMFRAAVVRALGQGDGEEWESRAFANLREMIVRAEELPPTLPRRNILEDQIIWGRSPVRLDLAGGWSDTPPYCLEHGGRVVNLAVNLNGQPPIQVFARGTNEPELVVRSIDLGVECRIRTYEELSDFARPDSEFALAKAALSLVGFLPQFHADGGASSLRAQLEQFGGGIEVTLLAAVPKGSGLGTSSILAATLLGVLADFCGLGWDRNDLYARTMALEQLLTTGGGWQDQIGGITRGIKLIETSPGLAQTPVLRWLPEHLFTGDAANRRILLYYTGLTRMAKNLLREIVRGMFLNRREHLGILRQIRDHAGETYESLQSGDYGQLCRAVNRTWQLKQALDAGTNPPAVADILARVEPWLAAAKLPGAGGGGYLFMLAHDEDAALRIRRELAENPPNPRARFVDFSLSDLGLQITRS
jgi:galactokinase/mevalonate kinase-like predicted kinase